MARDRKRARKGKRKREVNEEERKEDAVPVEVEGGQPAKKPKKNQEAQQSNATKEGHGGHSWFSLFEKYIDPPLPLPETSRVIVTILALHT